MATPPSNPPKGRAGRGLALLQALKASSGETSDSGSELSQPQPAVGRAAALRGLAGLRPPSTASAPTSQSSSASDVSASKPTKGRGALLAMMIKDSRQQGGAASASTTTVSSQESAQKLQGRGRADIMGAVKAKSRTCSTPGSASIETSSGVSAGSITESMKNLTMMSDGDAIQKHGTLGTRFEATSNWIKMSLVPDKAVFEYEVKFNPPIDARANKSKMLYLISDTIGRVKSFDGVKLWLPILMPREITELQVNNPITNELTSVKIILKKRTRMDECVQLYNVLFNRIMKVLKMARVGRNFYTPSCAVTVPQHKLEIWPGFVTAAHYMEGGLMLCVDTSHRVLRTETAYDVVINIGSRCRGDMEQEVANALVGSVVLTRYNNKLYRVDDIIFKENPTSTFENHQGKQISYVEYYKNAYDIKIKDLKQPMLLSKMKKMDLQAMKDKKDKFVCLVPELCFMTGLTDQMRSDFRIMKDLAQHTRLTPTARQTALEKFVKNVNEIPEAKQILQDWGLSIQPSTVKLEGRTLPPEAIQFQGREIVPRNADFKREAGKEKCLVPIDLEANKWLVLYVARDEEKAKRFVDTMQKLSRNIGMRIGTPQMIKLNNDRVDSYLESIKKFYSPAIQIAVIIFPAQREDRYSAVKKLCCAELCLPSQCVVTRTISNENKLRAITEKIALQMNCKIGGELWSVRIPKTGLMVCGVDVYHDPVRRGNSVVGFVASTSQHMTRWFSRASFQSPGDEIIHGLKISMMEALRHYHKIHHALPKSIIMYRDGVSDGMFKLTEDHEIPQISSIFASFEGDYNPKFSFVVVQKRINTRIYAKAGGNNLDNPAPGSVIDQIITKRSWYDFLLISQYVTQGTVSPTHYVVLKDGGNMKVDNMQTLTYKLTHMYYNWPGTVRVPAPCLYAHKLAYLVGQNIRKDPCPGLCDKLFYL